MHILHILAAVSIGVAAPEEFYQDFRGAKALSPELEVGGPKEFAELTFKEEGLAISLPADRPKPDPVGLRYRFPVRGDFDIVGTYEIIHAEVPKKGFGVGVSLVIRSAPAKFRSATVARYVRGVDKEVLVGDRGFKDENNKEKHVNRTLPAPASKTGRFQFIRTGSKLQYSSGVGTTGALEPFHDIDFGNDDLASVQFSATTGGGNAVLEVRLIDLRIRAERLLVSDIQISQPNIPTDRVSQPSISTDRVSQQSVPTDRGSSPLPVVSVLVLVIGVAIGGVWFWLRKKKKS